MTKNLKIAILGVGRIGIMHVRNVVLKVHNADVIAAADPFITKETTSELKKLGVKIITRDPNTIIANQEVDAFIICTPTNTHINLIRQIIKTNNKPIFCEKPLAIDWIEIADLEKTIKGRKTFIQVGYNRRFDINFKMVQVALHNKKIGNPYLVAIASYDPYPPPLAYVKNSGMIWNDMNIHDFDMMRFVLGEEVEEVFAFGANLIDPSFQGVDVDVTTINLKFKSGILGTIRSSRKSAYGYDQRIEVLGSKGRVKIDNVRDNTFKLDNANKRTSANPHIFFIERYEAAYVDEIKQFINAIQKHQKPLVSVYDDLQASKIAAACKLSYQEKRPVKIKEL